MNHHPDQLVYVPGLWRCAKCRFELIQSNLHSNGVVTARDQPGDKCPNCHSPLWRVTYRDAYADVMKRFEDFLSEQKSTPNPDGTGWLKSDDFDALVHFHMTCGDMDADGYTESPKQMERLAELGVVRKVRGKIYETSSFGDWLCETHWEQHPRLPLQTRADYNEASPTGEVES